MQIISALGDVGECLKVASRYFTGNPSPREIFLDLYEGLALGPQYCWQQARSVEGKETCMKGRMVLKAFFWRPPTSRRKRRGGTNGSGRVRVGVPAFTAGGVTDRSAGALPTAPRCGRPSRDGLTKVASTAPAGRRAKAAGHSTRHQCNGHPGSAHRSSSRRWRPCGRHGLCNGSLQGQRVYERPIRAQSLSNVSPP